MPFYFLVWAIRMVWNRSPALVCVWLVVSFANTPEIVLARLPKMIEYVLERASHHACMLTSFVNQRNQLSATLT